MCITLASTAVRGESCNDSFLSAVSSATDSLEKCSASFDYGKCIETKESDGSLAGDELSAAKTAMEQTRRVVLASEKCTLLAATSVNGPKMAAEQGNMKFSVDAGKGVVFEQFRGDTVSLFDLVRISKNS